MSRCQRCGRESVLVSRALEICADCIKIHFSDVLPLLETCRSKVRRHFDLPVKPPRAQNGLGCYLCAMECCLSPGDTSYCGLRTNIENKIVGANAEMGNVSWYHDALPTNCVADWVCPGGTGAGYPQFAYIHGAEYGYNNLAVFYQACSFDCLFCQNWHYRHSATQPSKVKAADLVQAVDDRTACICYFGGDPSPQLPHALRVSRLALKRKKDRILRICWESKENRIHIGSGGII